MIGAEKQSSTIQLTTEHAANLLFSSFRFSQGNPDLQELIFRYLRIAHPEWAIQGDYSDLPNLNNSLNRVFKEAETYVLKSGKTQYHPLKGKEESENIDEERMNRVFGAEMSTMENILFGHWDQEKVPPEGWAKDYIVQSLAQGIVERDYYFLVEHGGRDRQGGDPHKVESDPWSSHIVDYGLNGSTTRMTEYDQMFRDVNDYINSDHENDTRWNENIAPKLQKVVSVYNSHHPTAISSSVAGLGFEPR